MEAKWHVYVIVSAARNYTYVGLTCDVDRRLAEHNGGYNRTTAPYRPFRLLFTEEFPTRAEARIKEKFLKTGQGRDLVKRLRASDVGLDLAGDVSLS